MKPAYLYLHDLRESDMGLPHSMTRARRLSVPLLPRGYGVRQPYAAFLPQKPKVLFVAEADRFAVQAVFDH